MHTTERLTPTATESEGLAEVLTLIGTVFVAGPPVLVLGAGTVFLALLLVGPFALLVTLVAALAAVAALVALAGAILASPYLLVRHASARLATRRQASPVPAPAARVIRRPAIPVLARARASH